MSEPVKSTEGGKTSPKPELAGHRRVTMRQIAEAIGVSKATVSLALSNHPRISPAKRKEIQDKARELGYRPEPMLAALSHYRKACGTRPIQAAVAWINTWPDPKMLRSYKEFDHYWQGAAACAEKFGYRLEEFVVNQEMTPKRLEKVLLTRNIKGILLTPQHAKIKMDWQDFDWGHFSLVRLGRSNAEPQASFVTSAQAANAIFAFDRMRERGYDRIGYVGGLDRRVMWGAGFQWAQNERPSRLRLPPFFMDESNQDHCQGKFVAWLKCNRPDAIFAENPAVPRMLERAGYRVPQDIGLAGTTTLDTPIDAGIDQKPDEIGRVAMLVLISLINDNDRGAPSIRREILIQGKWADGSSLPPRK